ncbi:hypothetical protein PIB30_001216 [Stylosanthes scabra]|uniref:Very-long-chain aldehyde decarbonylase CER1-like C-terminal domain-containing protein n=1 Tax=Stylosanthes scabra TaxID=79078 RepID=A0ABU6W0M2_9FABA|nr:hypothetical protein [Stylosanthes scabra]
MIEEAILEAERKGTKVVSLGLMNQGEELNMYGGLYVSKNPKLKVKIVDGSSLVVALLLNTIPKGTTQVLLRGKLNKVAYAIAFKLCQQGLKVTTMHEDDYVKLKKSFNGSEANLVIAKNYTQTVWLVGEGLTEEEQMKAEKGTLFIPYSQFPAKKYRKDCSYHCTPAMLAPNSLENLHSCEDWLPRRVMSAWRIAGIVHSLEGWNEHECGYSMHNVDKGCTWIGSDPQARGKIRKSDPNFADPIRSEKLRDRIADLAKTSPLPLKAHTHPHPVVPTAVSPPVPPPSSLQESSPFIVLSHLLLSNRPPHSSRLAATSSVHRRRLVSESSPHAVVFPGA